MSKLLCLCGHIIVDQTDFLPFKATFLADQDQGDFFRASARKTVQDIQQKMKSLAGYNGELETFWESSSQKELEEVIRDTFAAHYFTLARDMYECEVCGRIWLQSKEQPQIFLPYQPERQERGILRSMRDIDESEL